MMAPRFIPLVLKQVLRHRTRSLLTVAGVAVAMFLFCGVQAMQTGAAQVTQATAADTTLVVYRKDRYCPFTSRMPQSYAERIRRVPGVAQVVPIKITVSNCRASLDVVTYRGVPAEAFAGSFLPSIRVVAGSYEEWQRRSDAALVSEAVARRRGLQVGDTFDTAGIMVYVAGIFRSDEPQHQNVAYTHLDFLQYASGSRAGGIVTQFDVRVADPQQLDAVARAVDAEFIADQDPTQTFSEKAFMARIATDVLEIIGFTRWLGWGALAAVLALVGNAIMLAVQDRVREHAVLQTLGFRDHLIARLIVGEGMVLGLIGGVVGSATALGVLRWGQFHMTVDGQSIPIASGWEVFALGLGVSVTLGIVAGLVPAWQAARRPIVECFRAV